MARSKKSKRKKKQKTKPKKTRNWLAVLAWFRQAGAMKDKKKEQSAKHCRKWKREDD